MFVVGKASFSLPGTQEEAIPSWDVIFPQRGHLGLRLSYPLLLSLFQLAAGLWAEAEESHLGSRREIPVGYRVFISYFKVIISESKPILYIMLLCSFSMVVAVVFIVYTTENFVHRYL